MIDWRDEDFEWEPSPLAIKIVKIVVVAWMCIAGFLMMTACTPHVETGYHHCKYPRTAAQIAADDDSNDHDYWTDEKCLPGWEVKDAN